MGSSGVPYRRGMENPQLTKIKAGWAASGDGWAVHAPTREEALRAYEEAKKRHAEIMRRRDKLGDNAR